MSDARPDFSEEADRSEERIKVENKLTNNAMEMALLSALLIKPIRLDILPPALKSDSFADPLHGEIFGAIVAIGHGADAITVGNALRPGDTDLRQYLAGLLASTYGSNVETVKKYAGDLVDLAGKRQYFAQLQRFQDQILAEGPQPDFQTLVNGALTAFEALSAAAPTTRPPSTLGEAVDAAIRSGESFAKGESTALSTGIVSIDGALGGMEPGGLYFIGGRPGSGKTAFGVQVATNVARTGAGVLVISLEMQHVQLGRRALAMESGIAQSILKEGAWDWAQQDAMVKAQMRLDKLPLLIEDQSGLNTQMISLRAKAFDRKYGLKLLVIDHVHIVATPEATTKMGATWGVGQVSNALKRIAKDLNIPVLALAQLSRGVEGREDKRPTMSDLRQSGDLEQDAEAIMLLYRPEYYLPKSPPERGDKQSPMQHDEAVAAWHDAKARLAGKAEVIFEKVRDGEPCSVPMIFDGARTCFREVM